MEKKLSPEARLARAKYMREWRKKNREKEAETRRRYWEKKAAQEIRQQNESNGQGMDE